MKNEKKILVAKIEKETREKKRIFLRGGTFRLSIKARAVQIFVLFSKESCFC